MWAGTTTVRVGDHHLGVRAYPETLHDALQQFFAACADETVTAPHNLSVRFEAPAVGEPTFVVYRAHSMVLSTRSPQRLLQALPRHLEGLVQPPGHPAHLVADAAAFSRDGVAVLAPSSLRHRLPQLAPHLRRAGVAPLEGLRPLIDPMNAELVIEPEVIRLDWRTGSRLRELAPRPGPHEPFLPEGRHPLRGWLLPEAAGPAAPSWAGRVARVLPLLSCADARQRLQRGAQLMEQLSVAHIAADADNSTLVGTISEALRSRL